MAWCAYGCSFRGGERAIVRRRQQCGWLACERLLGLHARVYECGWPGRAWWRCSKAHLVASERSMVGLKEAAQPARRPDRTQAVHAARGRLLSHAELYGTGRQPGGASWRDRAWSADRRRQRRGWQPEGGVRTASGRAAALAAGARANYGPAMTGLTQFCESGAPAQEKCRRACIQSRRKEVGA